MTGGGNSSRMKSRDDLNLVLKVNMENAPIFFVLQETGLFLKGEILKVKDVRFMTPEEISSASSIKVVAWKILANRIIFKHSLCLK